MNMKIIIGILILFLFIGVAVMFAVPPAPEPTVDPTPRTGDPPDPLPVGVVDSVTFYFEGRDGSMGYRTLYDYERYYTEADIARLKAETEADFKLHHGDGRIVEVVHH
ncbi:MAG: hypothetical protein PQ975_08645 [Methanobacterium sp.]|jgi:hypothetical protein